MRTNKNGQQEGRKITLEKKITNRKYTQDGKMKAKATFHVSSNETDESVNVWFMRDGCVCDGS